MAFRDDREALHARAEALEGELAHTRGELESLRGARERAAELAAELGKKERELAKLHAKLGGPAPRRGRAFVFAAVIGTVLLAGAGAGALYALLQGATEERIATDDGAQAALTRRPPIEVGATGHVTLVSGDRWELHAGDPCRVHVTPSTSPDPYGGRHRIEVWCAGVRILDAVLTCVSEPESERCRDGRGSSIDGSPRIDLNVRTGHLRMEDGPRSPWSVEVRLD